MVRGASAALSKARKTRSVPRAAIKRVSRDANRAADGAAAPDSSAPEAFPPAPDGGQQPGAGPTPRPASRRALKNWRVRSRLFLLVIIPTVTAVAAGGAFIASSVESALVNQRVLTLASLSGKITGLVQALQNEREDTVRFIVLGNSNGGRSASPSSATPPGPELGLLNQDYAVTNTWANQVKALAGGIGGAYSALAQQDTQAAVTAIGNLPAIRAAATGTQLPALIVIEEYATAINALLAVESQIAVGSGDSALAGSVRVLGLVSSMKEEASQQQALLTSALRSDLISLGQFGPAQQSAITDAQAQQQGNLNEFDTAATPAQRQLFDNVLSSSNVVQAQAQEQQAISLVSSKSPIAADPTISDASSALSYVVSGMRSAEQQFADSVISRSGSLHTGAITSAVIFSLAVALLLGIALTATTLIGQSMVGPLRRLRNGALEVAEVRLPEMVRRMSEPEGDDVPLEIEPIDVDSSDEIGDVARAFDQVHREAVRLAANEAALRGNVNAMFVNLSRRSQSLVERQIRMITRLERGEQDSDRLASLFQIDHLATRMRRNSENLLVIAGQELSRRWGQPVALLDVLRAAVSEIEQYERVTLDVQPGVSIRREAVRDIVHLTAELVENATSFSAADTPVTIVAHLLSSGGALIEIADEGVGMRAEAMANANWRLDNPPMVDVEVSRRMGLFVVAQLAARHGVRVRLRPVASGGLSALVWLPNEAITEEKSSPGPLRSVSATAGNRAAGHVTPVREAGQDAGTGQDSIAPAPRRAPLREHLGMADSDHYPLVDDPAGNAESWTATGPLPRIRGRLRAAALGPSSGPRDAEPGQGGGDQRTGTLSAAAEVGQHLRADGGSADWAESTPLGQVVVPAADGPADQDRLPIFDAVESDWFRGERQVIGRSDESSEEWFSPADDGFRAAEVVNAPTSDGTTRSGLPKRAPGTNLVPGTAAASAASEPVGGTSPSRAPIRSATENRNRFASYQRGLRQGRATAGRRDPNSGAGTAS
jgi:Nitrate and nitrite sensing/HAMP domain